MKLALGDFARSSYFLLRILRKRQPSLLREAAESIL
jgi:hypothetical protein